MTRSYRIFLGALTSRPNWGACEEAGEIFEPNPEIDQLCADAVRRVANKWDDYTEVRSSCHDWALDLVREYAKRDGINLVEIED